MSYIREILKAMKINGLHTVCRNAQYDCLEQNPGVPIGGGFFSSSETQTAAAKSTAGMTHCV
jgi:hypothetical protein